MAKNKHLTLEDRISISNYLDKNYSFIRIGVELGKDCTTISKEVRNHIIFKKTGAYGHPFNACLHRLSCDVRMLCSPCSSGMRYSFCRFCKLCNSKCPGFEQEFCPQLNKPPYVCNGCEKLRYCTLEKHFYRPAEAHSEYRDVLTESRSGISLSENEIKHLDNLVSPLIMRGQSLNHICANNKDFIMVSESTLYRYEMFSFMYGEEILKKLGCTRIPPNEVTLNPSIFERKRGKHYNETWVFRNGNIGFYGDSEALEAHIR